MKLSNRIALFVGVLVLLVAGGLGSVSSILSQKAALEEAEHGLEEASIQGAKYINARLQQRTEILKQVANHISTMHIEEQLEYLAGKAKDLGYLDMAVVDQNGIARYAVEKNEADLSDRVYVKSALYGYANFSNVLVSRVTNSTVIMYAAPIKSEDKVIGALIGRRDGASLNELIYGMTYGGEGSAYILGDDGTFYAHKEAAYIMEQKNVLRDMEEDGEYKDFGTNFYNYRISKEGKVHYDLNGVEMVASFVTIPNTQWVFALSVPMDNFTKEIDNMSKMLTTLIAIFIFLGVAATLVLGKWISKPIINVVDVLNDMSQYDMTTKNNHKVNKSIKRKDEIGIMAKATLVLQENLRTLIESIAQSAEHIAAASEELTATTQQAAESANEVADAVQDIATGAADQASDTEKGADEIEYLGGLIEKDQELIIELNGLADEVERLKSEGLEVLSVLVQKTDITNKTASNVRNVILETDESANKIDTASQMILSIASQINLLALNAAIEAARAGEQGRGFAVVADEIRKLAEQTNRFTGDIVKDIEELTGKSQFAVKAMGEVGDNLEEQTNSVDYTNTKFEGIATAIEHLRNRIDLLKQQSNEMNDKKNEIVGIIQNLSAISEENAAGTQEATASIEEQTSSMNEIANSCESLSGLAEEMQKSIAKFKI